MGRGGMAGAALALSSSKNARSSSGAARCASRTALATVAEIRLIGTRLLIVPHSERLNGTHGIDQSTALKIRGAIEIGRGRQENPLHLFRLLHELAPNRQECGNQSGDMRRSHAGPTILSIKR